MSTKKQEREIEEFPLEELARLPQFSTPIVSPDGDKVTFIWDVTGRNELHVLDLETGETEQLSDGEVPRSTKWPIKWGPNSQRVFFHKDEGGDEQNDIYAIDLEGEVESVVEAEGQCVIADSTDDHLLFSSTMGDQMNLYRHRFETGENERITEFEQPVWGGLFSPDGEKIAFSANESDNLENTDLYVADADGSNQRRIEINDDGYETGVTEWSPDSEKILISDNSPDKTRPGVYDLEEDEVEWYGSDEYEESPVTFTPEGEGVIAVRTYEAGKKPFFFGFDGTVEELDVKDGVAVPPGSLFSAQGGKFTSDGELILTQTSPDERAELIKYDFETRDFDTLIEPEYGDIDPDVFVDAEYITYESEGGLEIGALLYKPLHPEPEDGYPAVVVVHGGPHGQSTKSFNAYAQFLTNRGYAVLMPNYRGSTGRGREFKNMIHGDWGGGELEDIANAGEWIKEKDWIDEEKVAVFGGSYGGYSVFMQMVKKPKLWTTGVAAVGISDLHKMYEESMPHFKTFMEQQMGDPEENHDLWRERSAIEHVDNIEHPILMIHGVNDPRCPVSQSRIFRDALEEMDWEEGEDGDFEYVEFEEEGHGTGDIDQKIRWYTILEDYLDRRI